MTGQLLGLAALVAIAIWLVKRTVRARRPRDPDIDRTELEAAEREVRDLGTSVTEDDGIAGDDWGPGAAGRSRPRT